MDYSVLKSILRTCLSYQYRCLHHSSKNFTVKPPFPSSKKSKSAEILLAKPHFNIGTIGHVDHGKTTLTSAITKICYERGYGSKYISFENIDKAVQEQERGITINASHVEYSTKKRHYAHTDCPGHADYVKRMIGGTSQMDSAILVVACSEGSMPQTYEHIMLGSKIGLKNIVVYVNKCDLVDEETKELVELELRDLINSFGFDFESPFIFGSALMALEGDKSKLGEPSVHKLLETLDELPLPSRDFDSPFLMNIDSSLNVPSKGTVLIGTVYRGKALKGANLEVLGFGETIKTAVKDIQIFHKSVTQCGAGDHVGILLRGVQAGSIQRGMTLCAPNSIQMSNRYECTIYLLSKEEGGKEKPIAKKYIQQFASNCISCGCRLDVIESDLIMPGEHGSVHLLLPHDVVLLPRQQFTIRETNRTVATGFISKSLEKVYVPNGHLGNYKFNYEIEVKKKSVFKKGRQIRK